MPKPSYASVTLDVGAEDQPLPEETGPDTPFRILLLGDFSGRGSRGEPPPGRLRPYLVDRDNLGEVLVRLRPELDLGGPGRGVVFRFRELEDFHPDRIFARHDLFAALREQRRAPAPPAESAPPPPPPPLPRLPAGGNLLDDILDAADPASAAPARQPDAMRDFIDRAMAPHLAPRPDARLVQAVAQVDAAAGRLMRALLHHPHFQALEAGWRAIYWLVRGLETGSALKVYVLDIAKTDLEGSLHELERLLVEPATIPGAEPWALVVGNYTFARTEGDVGLLGELARIMQAAGAPWLAEADPTGAESEEADRLWQALRHSPAARSIGLALPRFLLRLPYGARTDTVESFAFEEMPGPAAHGNYLWGNPAFACAYLLGQAFAGDGWNARPGARLLIGGLPLHLYTEDGEQRIQPCAEMLMTESGAESILEQGFMPLASIKDQDAVRLVRFQSIADPPAPLAARWS